MKSTVSARANISQKVLSRKIYLIFEDKRQLQGRTLNVSQSGITMMCPWQIEKGIVCEVEFDILMDGDVRRVMAISKARDCVCVGAQGFRTALTILRVNAQGRQAINDWLQYAY